MPAPLNVDREAARVLCVAVGVNEAARQMGIPEPTMRAWSARGKWAASIEKARDANTLRHATNLQPVAVQPAQALANTLESRKSKSRLLLSKYVVNAAKVASRSRSPLKDAQNVRHIAAVHSAVWPEDRSAGGFSLQLGIMVGQVQ